MSTSVLYGVLRMVYRTLNEHLAGVGRWKTDYSGSLRQSKIPSVHLDCGGFG